MIWTQALATGERANVNHLLLIHNHILRAELVLLVHNRLAELNIGVFAGGVLDSLSCNGHMDRGLVAGQSWPRDHLLRDDLLYDIVLAVLDLENAVARLARHGTYLYDTLVIDDDMLAAVLGLLCN